MTSQPETEELARLSPAGFLGLLSVESLVATALFIAARSSALPVTGLQVVLEAVLLVGIVLLARWPRQGLALVVVAFAALWMAPEHQITFMDLSLAAVVHHWTRTDRPHSALFALATGVALGGLWFAQGWWEPYDLPFLVGLWLFSWGTGSLERHRARRLAQTQSDLSAEREIRIKGLHQTRLQLAGELHDTVAQTITVTAMQAEDLAELPGVPDEAREAALELAQLSRQSLDELRATLDALRELDEGFGDVMLQAAPPPETALEVGLDRLAEAGFDVHTEGEWDSALWDRNLAHAVSRVTSEAVGNMLRHGRPGPASLKVVDDGSGVDVVATNLIAGDSRTTSLGVGLVGAEERVRVLGGTFRIESDGRTWTLLVRIPHASYRNAPAPAIEP